MCRPVRRVAVNDARREGRFCGLGIHVDCNYILLTFPLTLIRRLSLLLWRPFVSYGTPGTDPFAPQSSRRDKEEAAAVCRKEGREGCCREGGLCTRLERE